MAKRNTRRVKLEQLFRWNAELPIRDHNGDVAITVHQRVVNDTDYDKARLGALRKSREVRLALRDSTTDEYAAMMESLERYDREGLVNVLLLDRVDIYYRQARDEARIRLPKRPNSGASQEEAENYEAEVDKYDDKFNKEVLSIVEGLSNKDKEQLEAISEDELRSMSISTLENQICTGIFNVSFSERLAWLGTYRDVACKNRYFKTFEEFEELSKEVKDQLVRGYKRLSLGTEDLKN